MLLELAACGPATTGGWPVVAGALARSGGWPTTATPARSEETMAITFQRNVGMLLLAVWLILYGLAGLISIVPPAPLMAVLALLAGVLILAGR
jgi:hypothetical protein